MSPPLGPNQLKYILLYILSICSNVFFPHMYTGKIGDWKNYFSDEESSRLDAYVKDKTKGSGLTFDFGD